jgi:hypothetical protein
VIAVFEKITESIAAIRARLIETKNILTTVSIAFEDFSFVASKNDRCKRNGAKETKAICLGQFIGSKKPIKMKPEINPTKRVLVSIG